MSVEVKRTPIFSDPDLEAEHSALHTMACIIAQKWMLDLESKDCSFSYDGLKWFYEDEMGEDMRQFKVLLDGHEKRIKEYRDKKRAERLADHKTENSSEKPNNSMERLQACIDCEHTDMCEWCYTRWSKDEPERERSE
jgi:hypothetical protein